jgi:hypothetical protein
MYVRLTAKLADRMEGVDVSAYAEGDIIDLAERDAKLLLMGNWAEPVGPEQRISSFARSPSAIAADGKSRENSS